MTKPDAGPTARRARGFLPAVAIILATMLPATTLAGDADPLVARGRYLVQIAGCNDCHTPDSMEKAGEVDESLWLTGSSLGWYRPWGTTYPPNLRLTAQRMTEDQWVVFAAAPKRPPMPWFAFSSFEFPICFGCRILGSRLHSSENVEEPKDNKWPSVPRCDQMHGGRNGHLIGMSWC